MNLPERKTGSTDQQLIDEVYTDDVYTENEPRDDKPKPLRTSWLYKEPLPPPRDRETEWKIFIDCAESGDTLCTAVSMAAAYELLEKYKKQGKRICIRPEKITEERHRHDDAEARKEARWLSGFGA